MVETPAGVEGCLVHLDRDLLTIPSLAIHQQRDVNKGHDYNLQRDMQPLYGAEEAPSLTHLLAEALGVEDSDILATDLVLCPRQKPVCIGPEGEFFQAPRIDDLGCAYATLEGLLTASPSSRLGQVYCLFDNEEVGSGTRQGALSSFLPDVLARTAEILGMSAQAQRQALASSLLLSADNRPCPSHPNFTEKADPENRPYLNGGVVIKLNASQKYTTTGLTWGLFRSICRRAGVPVQIFANRADEPGGSTLGNLLSHAVSIPMVDIGMAQLAMHSAVETAGSRDPAYLSQACAAFFSAPLHPEFDALTAGRHLSANAPGAESRFCAGAFSLCSGLVANIFDSSAQGRYGRVSLTSPSLICMISFIYAWITSHPNYVFRLKFAL